jgi:3-deoxy-manno-octulosonate cytidylyltransferase (CMP-KDO synthetase)
MSDTVIVVPARLGSQRFPRKLLFPLRGRPLILWTAANLRRLAGDMPLFFAVAESELEAVLNAEGYNCVQTDPDLPSGTDRIAAANQSIGASRIINVQGDEPVIHAEHLQKLCALMDDGKDMATLATPFTREDHFRDSNKVKVVIGAQDQALYFSRAPIPFNRNTGGSLPSHAYWHLGVYAYTAALLDAFTSWKPGTLEVIEQLEQLRVLENGGRIGVGVTQTRTVGIDVEEDLAELEAHLSELESQ